MKFTPREREVMALVAKGYEDKEIADRLTISARTVQKYIGSATLKFNARNRTQLAVLFTEMKYKKKHI